MRVFIDLDGPLLDVAPRYHSVHEEIIREHGGTPIDQPTYWAWKRARRPVAEIVAEICPSMSASMYSEAWGQRIEESSRFVLDRVVPGAPDALAALRARGATLHLVTLRRRADALARQLVEVAIAPLLDSVHSSPGETAHGHEVKEALVRAAFQRAGPGFFVGDTEVDILAGKALGLRTVAVLNGIRDGDSLSHCKPDVIVPDVTSVPAVVDAWLKEASV